MGIRRACSCKITFYTPKPPSNYTQILVTFAQNGNILSRADEIALLQLKLEKAKDRMSKAFGGE